MTDDEICALIALLNARVCEFERDFAYEVADAIVTGERPDLRDYEIEVSLHEVTTTVTAMTSLLARAEAAEAETAALRAKLGEAVGALHQMVGGAVYSASDGFSKPHEPEHSRIARATLARITEGEG